MNGKTEPILDIIIDMMMNISYDNNITLKI